MKNQSRLEFLAANDQTRIQGRNKFVEAWTCESVSVISIPETTLLNASTDGKRITNPYIFLGTMLRKGGFDPACLEQDQERNLIIILEKKAQADKFLDALSKKTGLTGIKCTEYIVPREPYQALKKNQIGLVV